MKRNCQDSSPPTCSKNQVTSQMLNFFKILKNLEKSFTIQLEEKMQATSQRVQRHL